MTGLLWVPWLPLADPPLAPSGDEGRSLLRRELLHPEYHRDNMLERFVALALSGCSTRD